MKAITFLALLLIYLTGAAQGQTGFSYEASGQSASSVGGPPTLQEANKIQGYEAAVLSTFYQSNPVGQVDMSNYGHVSIQDMERGEASVLSSFRKYDVSGDGRISGEEFDKMGGIQGITDFGRFDKDKDGYISQNVLRAALRIKTRAPEAATKTPPKDPKQLHEEAHPTLRVYYDPIDGYYVK